MPQSSNKIIRSSIPAIALAVTLVLHLFGGGLYFHIQRSQIRREIKTRIKQGVPQNELKVFSFVNKEELARLQWHNDHEFMQDGEMFDVVRTEEKGGCIYLHCINDKQETVLFAQLNEWVNKRALQDPIGKQQQELILSLNSPYLQYGGYARLAYDHWEIDCGQTEYTYTLKTWICDPVSPPPRLIG